jgi:hypothetical protein
VIEDYLSGTRGAGGWLSAVKEIILKIHLLFLFVALFSACSSLPVELSQEGVYLKPVEGYLVENIGIASFSGQVFCSYEVLDTKQEEAQVDMYVWAMCQEYYLEGRSLVMGTGSSLPVALHLQGLDGGYRLASYEVPKDGIGYWPSIQAIFPALAIERMCEGDTDCYNGRAERLERESEQKAKAFYSIK